MYKWEQITLACLLFEVATCRTMEKKCMVQYDLSMCYPFDGRIFSRNQTCSPDCERTYNISSINMQPYNAALVGFLLRTCCGECTALVEVNTFEHISEATPLRTNTSHFVFPVLGPATAVRLHGYYFIPFVEPPVLYYITTKNNAAIVQLLISFRHIWPVIVICLLMTAIAGFICWAIETRSNKDQFPRRFLIGWFDGFWWSFVTMTTVGYGDKTPKSVFGRLFAILWILIGIHVCSIIVAEFVAEIHSVNYPPPPKLAGAKVGALRYRVYDASVIARQGGILIDVHSANNTYAILELIGRLQRKKIDGLILDRYTYITFSRYLNSDAYTAQRFANEIRFFKTRTLQIEERHEGEKMSFGILVRYRRDYEYLSHFVRDNAEALNTCNGLLINGLMSSGEVSVEATKYRTLFSIDGVVLWPFLVAASSVVAAISCFGVMYEILRWKWSNKQKDALTRGERVCGI